MLENNQRLDACSLPADEPQVSEIFGIAVRRVCSPPRMAWHARQHWPKRDTAMTRGIDEGRKRYSKLETHSERCRLRNRHPPTVHAGHEHTAPGAKQPGLPNDAECNWPSDGGVKAQPTTNRQRCYQNRGGCISIPDKPIGAADGQSSPSAGYRSQPVIISFERNHPLISASRHAAMTHR